MSETSEPIPGERVLIRWLEQSHFMLQTHNGVKIHFDPYLSRTIKPENFIHPEPLISPDEVQGNIVFLTHDHRDHTDPDTLVPMARNNPGLRIIGSAESCEHCVEVGIDSSMVRAVAAGDTLEESGIAFEVVYAEDTSDANFTPHLGFILALPTGKIYVTGDTRTNVSDYADKLERIKSLRPKLLIVPVNPGYNNPGPTGAREIVEMTDPDIIIPCHFGCFKNNTIDPAEFIDVLPEGYRERTRILGRGESFVL